eukprot:16430771-Heterocapsa_arctica.AAC.1
MAKPTTSDHPQGQLASAHKGPGPTGALASACRTTGQARLGQPGHAGQPGVAGKCTSGHTRLGQPGTAGHRPR